MSISRYEGKVYFDKSIPLNVLLKAIDEVNVLVKDQRAFGTTIEKYDGRKLSQSDWTHAVVQFAYWPNPYCTPFILFFKGRDIKPCHFYVA